MIADDRRWAVIPLPPSRTPVVTVVQYLRTITNTEKWVQVWLPDVMYQIRLPPAGRNWHWAPHVSTQMHNGGAGSFFLPSWSLIPLCMQHFYIVHCSAYLRKELFCSYRVYSCGQKIRGRCIYIAYIAVSYLHSFDLRVACRLLSKGRFQFS